MKNDFDFLTGRNNPYLKSYQDFLLHEKVIGPLKLLQEKAKDEIGADLKLISSFRDHEKQLLIWNNKALGKRAVYDDDDKEVDLEKLSQYEKIERIMRFSALPGASRHHWGTDIDVYDASKLSKDKVNLTPSECGPGDIFCELHEWLDEKIKMNDAFGFYRPYSEDKGGISPERWHLSYSDIAQEYFDLYDLEIFQKNIHQSDIELRETILENIESLYNRYIFNISLP